MRKRPPLSSRQSSTQSIGSPKKTRRRDGAREAAAGEEREGKIHQDALRESQERLRLHVESSPVAVVEWGGDLEITRWAGEAENMFGWRADEVIGRRIEELPLVYEADIPVVQRTVERLKDGKSLRVVSSNRNMTKDGRVIHCTWYNSVLLDARGQMNSVLSLVLDNTAQKNAEQALRESEERFRVAQELSLDGFTVLESVRDEQGTIVDFRCRYINPAAARLLSHTREELQGAGLLEALAENKSERQLFDRYVRVVETGKPHDVEILYESHDAARWFRNMAVKLGDGVAVYFSDITERKEADDALRKADKLAAAGRMAATVAHEINNPLASVVNSLYLLSKEKLSTQSREFLDLASRELERVVRISRQTLSFYRGTDRPTHVDVLQVANDIVQAYTMLAERHGIKLELRGEGKHPIHGYPGEIRQMIANLLTNSLESGGSRVLVRISDVHRNGRKGHPNTIRISVADDGKGIKKEDQRRIFEPFFTTKGEKGTGLGLWVTRGIVTKHEGKLMLRSSTRQGRSGTSISVLLPRATEHSKHES